MNVNLQNSNDPIVDDASCKQREWKDDYAACNSEIAALKEQLDITLSRITGDRTKCPFIRRADVKSALWNSSRALTSVSLGLRQRPSSVLPGRIISTNMYDQVLRASRRPLIEEVDAVQAHIIPQSKDDEILLNQIVATELLRELPRFPGKNDSWLYCTGKGRRNSRAKVHLEDETESIFGKVWWVP